MQKNLLVAAFALVFISFSAQAQIKKGAVLLGGQLSFYSQSSSSSLKNKGFTLLPAVGKAVSENLVLGADIVIGSSRYQPSSNYSQNASTLGAGFFVRRYKTLGSGFYFFLQARAGGLYNGQDVVDGLQAGNTATTRGYTVQVSAFPGVAYSVSKKFQLEAGLNNLVSAQYDHSKQTMFQSPNSITKTNNFSLGTSLSNFSGLSVGFRVLLN